MLSKLRPSRLQLVNAAQGGGLATVAVGVGFIYWQAGVILAGLAVTAVAYLHGDDS